MNGSKKRQSTFADASFIPNKRSKQEPYPLGSVTRVELTNFMCHSSLSFEPGPEINLITGANGAGKSSIFQVSLFNPIFQSLHK